MPPHFILLTKLLCSWSASFLLGIPQWLNTGIRSDNPEFFILFMWIVLESQCALILLQAEKLMALAFPLLHHDEVLFGVKAIRSHI